ncbi:hypothetical protein ACEPAF_8957 [Sanghuangporus sanghuang]
MWTLRPNSIDQDGERPVWAVFASHEEAYAALSLVAGAGIGYPSINVMPALESELEPFLKLQAFSLKDISNVGMDLTLSTQSSMMGVQMPTRYPPSPPSSNVTDAETEAELFFPDARDDLDFIRGFTYGFNQSQASGLILLMHFRRCKHAASHYPPILQKREQHSDTVIGSVPSLSAALTISAETLLASNVPHRVP